MEIERVQISELIEYENNPRFNEYAIEPVRQSIEQVGYVSPIVVDENKVVLAGHTRLLALKELNVSTVDVVVIKGLSDEQKRKFRILDNKTSEIAEWDEELLRVELDGLDLDGIHWFDDLVNPAISDLAETSSKTKETKERNEKDEDTEIRCPRCGAVVLPYKGEPVETVVLPFGGDYEDEPLDWGVEDQGE